MLDQGAYCAWCCFDKALPPSHSHGPVTSTNPAPAGAPKDIISWVETPSLPVSQALMQAAEISLILATGGPAMVKAAYTSGNPSLGVGAGNTPALIDETASIELAVSSILLSKTFDNGVICASEQVCGGPAGGAREWQLLEGKELTLALSARASSCRGPASCCGEASVCQLLGWGRVQARVRKPCRCGWPAARRPVRLVRPNCVVNSMGQIASTVLVQWAMGK